MSDSSKEKIWKQNYYEKNREKYILRARAQRQTPEYKAKQPLRSRVSLLKRRYGITIEDYNNFLIVQNNQCAICGIKAEDALKKYKVKYLDIDHCHRTGKVRGVLCRECNVMLGHLEKPENILKKAYAYINIHKVHIKHHPQ